ncbi:MAG: hypothetical protein IPI67_24720 [Myxococcales bacterium]|nr:hypothetical protein [Myxococcales bacterium]
MHGAVTLELTHLPADAEHHAVGGRRRVVHAVLVGDQRTRPATQVHEVMPVGIVARQARHLEAHHDADLAAGNGGHQPAEAGACSGQRAALP